MCCFYGIHESLNYTLKMPQMLKKVTLKYIALLAAKESRVISFSLTSDSSGCSLFILFECGCEDSVYITLDSAITSN